MLISQFSIAQKEVYIDENMKEITFDLYNKKCFSEIFKCKIYETDSLKVNKVLYRYAFGKISLDEHKQLRQLLMKRSGSLINADKTIIINYRDTLFDFASRVKMRNLKLKKIEEEKLDRKKNGNISIRYKFKKLTNKSYLKGIQKREKHIQKCVTTAKIEHNSNVFYMYNHDKGYVKDTKKVNWIKDNGVIKNTFFSIIYQSHLVIIKPDGSYFLSGSYLSDDRLRKILDNNWSSYIQDWRNSITTNSKSGLGFFEREKTGHNSHCF